MDEIHMPLGETMKETIAKLLSRLKVMSIDVDKVNHAKELLMAMQRRKAFVRLIGVDDDDDVVNDKASYNWLQTKYSSKIFHFTENSESEVLGSGEDLDEDEDPCLIPFEEDRWRNFFTGFEILTVPQGIPPNENRKCIEIEKFQCEQELKVYLLSGVRCFLLDLFTGTQRDNQALIVQLRDAELSVAKEFDFPVVSTIIAKLTPRYQYTGYLHPELTEGEIELKAGYKLLLTVDRMYSNRCTSRIIYVNARFLFGDIKEFDFILIGCNIQLVVRGVGHDYLKCCVARDGILTSYMPVLFPPRCSKFRVSYEELEDITFSREVGINVIVSNMAGSKQYLDDLESVMAILECQNLRLFARVVLNEIIGCDGDMNWVAQRYDGFLVELAPPKPERTPDIMHLCPDAECFMQLAYQSKKPILLDPTAINEQKLRIDPEHYYYTFYYPDKYVIKCQKTLQAFYFTFLQNAIFEQIPPLALSKMPYCDNSHTGADSLARAVVTASIECQAVAIVVIGVTTRMLLKIAHFRPMAQILFVSHMRSAEDYASMYYNVTMLPYRTSHFTSHRRNTYRKAIYGLAYLAARKKAQQDDQVILVYNYEAGTTFPEKYLIYKFDKQFFPEHLALTMFPLTPENQVDNRSLMRA